MTDLTLTEQQAAQALATKQMTQDIAEAHETMGMIKAFNFVSKLLTVGTLKKLQEIKETKKYKGLSYLDQDGKLLTVGSFAEYCKACGLSDKKVWEDLTNLNTFGEEFIETSQRLGLGYREMRKLRQLPDEARTEIVEADYSETADKEDLLEKIEDLTSQHAKVKAELESKLKRKSEDYEAQAKILASKDEKINRLSMDLTNKTKLIDNQTPEQRGKTLRDETAKLGYTFEANIRAGLNAAFQALSEHQQTTGADHKQFMVGVLAQMEVAINELRGIFELDSTYYTGYVPRWVAETRDEKEPVFEAETFEFEEAN